MREFIGNQTDFGGTDSPLSAEEAASAKERCGGAEAWHLPAVFGSVAITFNLANVDTLALDAPTLARIFNGEITAERPVTTRSTSISGAPIRGVPQRPVGTSTFQHYLEAASGGAWGKGVGRTWNGGVGEARRGNQGAATAVNSTDGAIGYAEWSFAQQRTWSANIVTGGPPSSHQRRIQADSVAAKVSVAVRSEVIRRRSTRRPSNAYPTCWPPMRCASKYPDADTRCGRSCSRRSAVGRPVSLTTDTSAAG